jgi:hypothetical protein
MKRSMITAAALAACGLALAKLPPPDDAAKAKAAEAAAKSGWQAKVDAYALCKVQDRIAAKYKGSHPAQAGQSAPSASAAGQPASAAQAASTAQPASGAPSASAAASATKMPVATAATASQGGGTPVAAVTNPAPSIPPCADPGPFAYTPAAQKPLESSEAHSPAGNATSPPSVRAESGSMTSGKTGAGAKQ